MDSITIHTASVRKALQGIASHKANPASACICHKCENARKENA